MKCINTIKVVTSVVSAMCTIILFIGGLSND